MPNEEAPNQEIAAGRAPEATREAAPEVAPDAGPKILAPAFNLNVLGSGGLVAVDPTLPIEPPTFFQVSFAAPPEGRDCLTLVQKDAENGEIVVLLFALGFDRQSGSVQLPVQGPDQIVVQRSIVRGTVHVLASIEFMTREEIVAFIGGHEGGVTLAKPPYT